MRTDRHGNEVKTCWELLALLREACCGFHSIERDGLASNGEIKRWFLNKAVHINGMPVAANDPCDFWIDEIVLFPKGIRRTTLWGDS